MELKIETLSEKTATAPATRLVVQDWGQVPFQDALRRQLDLVDLVHHELSREAIILCSHPPVVTIGRGTQPGDVFGWDGELVEINRGGRATYHGPSQLVAYPIIDLTSRGRDLHRYMRALEDAVIATLADLGIQAQGRSLQTEADGVEVEATGVWVGSKKIASIGIGVRKWVAFHGLALNVDHDPSAFRGLKPCGFTTETMTCVEDVLGSPVERARVQSALAENLIRALTSAAC